MVAVVDPTQLAQLQVSSQRCSFGAEAFHHVAIAGQCEHAVLEQAETGAIVSGRQPGLSDGHADTGRYALTERAGGGFDAAGPTVFRMARAAAASLPKALQVGHAHCRTFACRLQAGRGLDAAQMQHPVEQGGSMADRQHETITIRPSGVLRIKAHKALPQAVGGRRCAHRRARMTGVGILHLIDGQRAQRVDAAQVEGLQRLRVHSRSSRNWR